MSAVEETCDVLVIGAGPAGLTAACYLARYRRRVIVVHDGRSRALRIPLTRNAPGFPGGVAGPELIERMEAQARLYGAEIRQDRITRLTNELDGFVAEGGLTYRARAVIIATGVQMNQVDLPHEQHENALALGCLRYCPVCDGYEAKDKIVAVLGSSAHGAREALFLREYTADVTLLPDWSVELSADQRAELEAAGVKVIAAPVDRLLPGDGGMQVLLRDGTQMRFDVLYPALGCEPRSSLVEALGCPVTAEGCIQTGPNQELLLPGLYAAGDVVDGLDQISVAAGHGAVAATRAHNFLRAQDGMVLQS